MEITDSWLSQSLTPNFQILLILQRKEKYYLWNWKIWFIGVPQLCVSWNGPDYKQLGINFHQTDTARTSANLQLYQ